MTHALLAFLVAVTISHPAGAAASAHQRPTTPRTPADVTSDFNGDGYEDLAISVFTEDVGTVADAGAVNVIYGSAGGLSATNNQFWTEDDLSSSDGSETLDMFGRSMAAGDLNGDGYDDLVIGIMHEDLEGIGEDAGALTVLYGSAAGLTATGN